MELEELKNNWQAVNSQATTNILSPVKINEMTQKKYAAAINKIKYPEWAGSIVCLVSAAYILANLNKLNTTFFMVAGIIAIATLVLLPLLSLLSIYALHTVSDVNKPYAETIRQFALKKIRFQRLQKLNAVFSSLLLVSLILVTPKLVKDVDISRSTYFWVLAFPLGYLYLLFISALVKRLYYKALKQAEELLQEVAP